MCPSRLGCSAQVATESTAVLFDNETAGDRSNWRIWAFSGGSGGSPTWKGDSLKLCLLAVVVLGRPTVHQTPEVRPRAGPRGALGALMGGAPGDMPRPPRGR